MTVRHLLTISRPRFWLYEAGTFALGVTAALVGGEGVWEGWLIIWFLYFLIPANLLIYGVNDVFDYETDRLNPKKQGYEDVLPKTLHNKVLVAAALSTAPFLGLLLRAPVQSLIPFVCFLVCAIFYSAPPIRAKARPVLDSVFSAGHYVATGWFGYVLAGGMDTPWLALAAGMSWAIAMHAYSAVPDRTADRAAGLQTIATFLGGNVTVVVCALLYISAGILAVYALRTPWIALLIAPYVVMMGISLSVVKNEYQLLRIYRYFPLLNALTGAIIWWAIVLQAGTIEL